MLEPYEKSLTEGSYHPARRAKTGELAKEQALRMFMEWARKNWGKSSPRHGSRRRLPV